MLPFNDELYLIWLSFKFIGDALDLYHKLGLLF